MSLGPLWEATRDLHHAVENGALGRALAAGTLPRAAYARWLASFYVIHGAIDPFLPEAARRAPHLHADITACRAGYRPPAAALAHATQCFAPRMREGAAYVLLGAHLMGGALLRRRCPHLPMSHAVFADRREALDLLQDYRLREDLAPEARACFAALQESAKEIMG